MNETSPFMSGVVCGGSSTIHGDTADLALILEDDLVGRGVEVVSRERSMVPLEVLGVGPVLHSDIGTATARGASDSKVMEDRLLVEGRPRGSCTITTSLVGALLALEVRM